MSDDEEDVEEWRDGVPVVPAPDPALADGGTDVDPEDARPEGHYPRFRDNEWHYVPNELARTISLGPGGDGEEGQDWVMSYTPERRNDDDREKVFIRLTPRALHEPYIETKDISADARQAGDAGSSSEEKLQWYGLIKTLLISGVIVVSLFPLIAGPSTLKSVTIAAVPAIAAVAFHLFSVRRSAFDAALELNNNQRLKNDGDEIARCGMGAITALGFMGGSAFFWVISQQSAPDALSGISQCVPVWFEPVLAHGFMIASSVVLTLSLFEYENHHTWFEKAWEMNRREQMGMSPGHPFSHDWIWYPQSENERPSEDRSWVRLQKDLCSRLIQGAVIVLCSLLLAGFVYFVLL